MNKEIQFANTLTQVRNLAKEQEGIVSRQQVEEAFAGLELSEEQLELVFDYLKKHKVGIGEPVNYDDYLTDKERDYLQDYLEEIAALPSFTSGEKEACIISSMAGETGAQNRLVEMYLAEVADIAKLYAGQGVLLEDLIGEGNVALAMGVTMLGSVEAPQEAEGMLVRMIMNAMEEYIKEHVDAKAADRKVEDKVNKVSKKARELSEALQRKVTVEELAQESGLSEKAIRDAMRMSGFRIEEIEEE